MGVANLWSLLEPAKEFTVKVGDVGTKFKNSSVVVDVAGVLHPMCMRHAKKIGPALTDAVVRDTMAFMNHLADEGLHVLGVLDGLRPEEKADRCVLLSAATLTVCFTVLHLPRRQGPAQQKVEALQTEGVAETDKSMLAAKKALARPTEDMKLVVAAELKKAGIPVVRAPKEADSQLGFFAALGAQRRCEGGAHGGLRHPPVRR